MAEFHWIDSTDGGGIAIGDAVRSIKAMRKYRLGAAPVIELATKFMPTKFGGRQRPHFIIHNWITMSGSDPQPAALPAPAPAAPIIEATPVKEEPVAAAKPRPKSGSAIDSLKIAEPLTLREEMSDEIPW
jgi:hypothetical protein